MPSVVSPLPAGTVTFLFTDIVGSTRLWAADPTRMSEALRVHDEILHDTIGRFQGHVFSTAGDSFAASFAEAEPAVLCAGAIQQALAAVDWGDWPGLSIRIGLHIGEAVERNGNYFGETVNLAARVMSVAHGGQVVMTDAVRDSAHPEVSDLGDHVLRDIDGPVHLSQLGHCTFPPLTSLGSAIVSLPSPRTSLIGRDPAVAHIRELVGAHRLVTLTGVGGAGKTRLATEVAWAEVPSHPQGVWFVDLSRIDSPGALPGVFLATLRLSAPGPDPVAGIGRYLARRRCLMVVDNCEHVLDEAADVIDQLLDLAPGLRVLATSRQALDLEGEFAWRIPSLGTDARDGAPAVQLFLERAEAAGAELSADTATVAVVAGIVERLDGIPLAIELAAARARTLSLDEIGDLLDDRFAFLDSGPRAGSRSRVPGRNRQQTLAATVQWSYDLLSDAERRMLRVLSVFHGGFDPVDAIAVSGLTVGEGRRLIDSLVAKSLVDVTRDRTGQVRSRLLETIRMFARARLDEAGEEAEITERHHERFSVAPNELSIERLNDIDRVIRAGREYENIRAALTWALAQDRTAAAVRTAALTTQAAHVRGEGHLGMEVLRRPCDLSAENHAFVKTSLAWALLNHGDPVGAAPLLQEALATDRANPGDHTIRALEGLGAVSVMMGDPARSFEYHREAYELACAQPSATVRAASALYRIGDLIHQMQFDRAVAMADEVLAAAPAYAYNHHIQARRAWALLASGRIDAAVAAVESFSPIPAGSAAAHYNVIVAHTVAGHTIGPETAAKSLATEIIEAVRRRPTIRSDVLQGFAYLAHLAGDRARAREIVHNTAPFVAVPIFLWVLFAPEGATPENAVERLVRLYAEDPAADRFARDAANSARLMEEELRRWGALD